MASEALLEVQSRIATLVKEAPHLEDLATEKLAKVAAELENDGKDVSAVTGPKPFEVDFEKPFGNLQINFNKFKSEKWLKETERYEPLKKGQWPKFMIITCVDSRVSPATVLGLEPGEAFVLRSVANLVPPFEKEGYPSAASAIEYAVKHLKVEHILVNGHHSCGGISNLLHTRGGKDNRDHLFVERWIDIANEAYDRTDKALPEASPAERARFAEREAVNVSLQHLLTYPFVVEAVEARKLKLHGSYYNFVDGEFEHWEFVDGVVGPTQLL